MIEDKKVSLVLPCYNEEAGLWSILKKDLSFIDEIVVIDNNSTDRTAEIANKFNCIVVKEEKRGYGAAYKAGFKKVTGDIIIAIDGDGTYPIEEAGQLIEKLLDTGSDFISGNRFARGKPKTMPLINYLGNRLFTLITKLLFIRNIKDSWSGMWIFRREVLDKINLQSDGMALSQEIKIEVYLKKYKLAEFPISYHERKGKVKLRRFRDGFGALLFLIKKKKAA